MADRKFSTALLLDGKGGARQLNDGEIECWQPDDGLLWIDLNLSIVAAIFLPLSFVTGLLGMNVAGLPGVENPHGFLLSAIVMIGLGIGLVAFFRWKKWV